jgi:hypothetical protein
MTTHVHEPVLRSNSEIAEQVQNIHPWQFAARVLLTAVGFPFTAFGWLAGTSWFVVVFSTLWAVNRTAWLGQCVSYGFHKGARYKLVPKKTE